MHARPVRRRGRIRRITSYNVCYTKLLRSGVDFILADDIEQAMWNKFVFWSALAGATCTLRANIVITSYSIHYTKLYDFDAGVGDGNIVGAYRHTPRHVNFSVRQSRRKPP